MRRHVRSRIIMSVRLPFFFFFTTRKKGLAAVVMRSKSPPVKVARDPRASWSTTIYVRTLYAKAQLQPRNPVRFDSSRNGYVQV